MYYVTNVKSKYLVSYIQKNVKSVIVCYFNWEMNSQRKPSRFYIHHLRSNYYRCCL